ncbi:hypothetical protein L6452_03553 [Arctium lappa]|uniref:Uncharacterized protein n=1 Tax=Arctium lappa TaxID=4217 RepID=A0ACB9FNJ4_ARCLA|nr:hypothetical protein L6452_03553 [Arctium lappa]
MDQHCTTDSLHLCHAHPDGIVLMLLNCLRELHIAYSCFGLEIKKPRAEGIVELEADSGSFAYRETEAELFVIGGSRDRSRTSRVDERTPVIGFEKYKDEKKADEWKKVRDAVEEWLDGNDECTKVDEFEAMIKVLERKCNPIIARMYEDGDDEDIVMLLLRLMLPGPRLKRLIKEIEDVASWCS